MYDHTLPEDVIRGRKLTDLESMTMSIPDIPIWTDDGMILAPITDNGTIPLDSSIEYMIQIAAAKAYASSSQVHPPIDYMDIGKKIGVSSTQGMELHTAVNKAYDEWKEKHHDNT